MNLNYKWLITILIAGQIFAQQPADSLTICPADSFFQISTLHILPDSLIHYEHRNGFESMYPEFKKMYVRRGLLATTIVSNWAAFYLKRQADDYYRQYQRASELGQIKHYYNKTARYDNYATAMLIISGAALTAYLYFLFTD